MFSSLVPFLSRCLSADVPLKHIVLLSVTVSVLFVVIMGLLIMGIRIPFNLHGYKSVCNKVYSIGLWSSYSQCTRGEAVAYALVVVREGYNPNQLNWPAVSTDMYNPTMDVLISGVLTSESYATGERV